MMPKAPSKKRPAARKTASTPATKSQEAEAAAETQRATKARKDFANQARARGEVAPKNTDGSLPEGALYTEDAPQQLTRHRFSALPPLPPAKDSDT